MGRFTKGETYDQGLYLGERVDDDGLFHIFDSDTGEVREPFTDEEVAASQPAAPPTPPEEAPDA